MATTPQKVSAPIPYTSSPLGLVTSFNEFQYPEENGNVRSIFSAYQSKGQKHLLKRNKGFNDFAALSGTPHSDEVYDISTSNIIDRLKTIEHLKLNFADFAYLKDFGVYPNNRLMVARRFPSSIIDDLYSLKNESSPGNPISTVVGYFGDSEDFPVKLTFNEEWGEAEVSFVSLLNSLGKDFGFNLGGGLGSILEGGVNAVPLPGATLLLQRKIMKALGIITNEDDAEIPQGDPNLIKEAKSRTLIGEDDAGSGLSCKISVDLKTKYEQKFINGVDPTIVFMDILNNALNMGTSVATFYLGKQNDAEGNVKKFLEKLVNDPGQTFKDFLNSLIEAFKGTLDKLDESMKKSTPPPKPQADEPQTEAVGGGTQIINDITKLIGETSGEVKKYVADFIRAKYKIKFFGIINALTGGPSTPWHITIGNPLRPVFCSGDMLCKSVEVNFGPQLSFNDLPTYIDVTVKLESARNIGLQEIFSKFNTGGIRTISGTQSGEYLPGVADSFWNYKQLTATSSTLETSTGQETQSTDNIEQTDNKSASDSQDNQSKVAAPTTTTSPTESLDSGKAITADPQSTDKVLVAGASSDVDSMRVDNSQDTTGSTEGSVDQIDSPDNIPYTGQDAQPSPQDNNTPKWEVGKRVNRGSNNVMNLSIKWEVKQDATPGYYAAYVDGEEISSGQDISSITEDARWGAEDKFNSQIISQGLDKSFLIK